MIRLLRVRIVKPALDQPTDQNRQAASPIDRQAVPRHVAGCRLGLHHAPPSTRPIPVAPHGRSVVLDSTAWNLQWFLAWKMEASWKEDHRRDSNGLQFHTVLVLVTRTGPSVDFCGYWQRSRQAA
jgi:hypothetical protein